MTDEAIGLVQSLRLRVHPVCRSEVGNADELAETFEAVADHCQRPGLPVKGFGQVVEDNGLGAGAVEFFEGLPDFRLGRLHKCDELGWKDRPLAVKRSGIALGVSSLAVSR